MSRLIMIGTHTCVYVVAPLVLTETREESELQSSAVRGMAGTNLSDGSIAHKHFFIDPSLKDET